MEARALARGQVAVGVLPTIAPYFLPAVLRRFSAAFPGMAIIVQEDTTTRLLQQLATCELDLALASLPIHDTRFESETLFWEELRVALPPLHPLLKKPSLCAPDLDRERFILMKEGHCLGDQVLAFCTRRDFHPQVLCRSAQIETILGLVQSGLGVSLIPAMACRATAHPRLQYRSLAPPVPRRAVAVHWLRRRPLGRAATAFLESLRPAGGAAASRP
jgi:LysR family hydrogen peroxide-inducible transcriptional activator